MKRFAVAVVIVAAGLTGCGGAKKTSSSPSGPSLPSTGDLAHRSGLVTSFSPYPLFPGVPKDIVSRVEKGGGGFRPDAIAYFEKVLGQAYNGVQAKSLAGCVAARIFRGRNYPNEVGVVNVSYFTMNYILGLPTSNVSSPQGDAAQQVVTDALNACGSQPTAQPAAPAPTQPATTASSPSARATPTSSGGQDFCSSHTCIPNFNNGTGYIVQCADGEWSHSGGRPGACSDHGGEMGRTYP